MLLVDIYKLRDPFSGLGQFSDAFARNLLMSYPDDLCFIVPEYQSWIDRKAQVKDSVSLRYFSKPKVNIWHSLHQFPSHLPPRDIPWVLTIHDLNFLVEKTAGKLEKYKRRLGKYIGRASKVTCISESTKEQVVRHFGQSLRETPAVIYNGVMPLPSPQRPSFMQEIQGPYFFSIGAINRKKNFHTLLPLLEYYKDHRMIIAGHDHTTYAAEIRKLAEEKELTKRLILPGTVTDAEKSWLYQHCDVFLFPSLAEGFGIPVIEALSAGKPVVTSRTAALVEIGGGISLAANPDETDEFIEATEAARTAQTANGIKYAEKFHWPRVIQSYMQLYKTL